MHSKKKYILQVGKNVAKPIISVIQLDLPTKLPDGFAAFSCPKQIQQQLVSKRHTTYLIGESDNDWRRL